MSEAVSYSEPGLISSPNVADSLDYFSVTVTDSTGETVDLTLAYSQIDSGGWWLEWVHADR